MLSMFSSFVNSLIEVNKPELNLKIVRIDTNQPGPSFLSLILPEFEDLEEPFDKNLENYLIEMCTNAQNIDSILDIY